MSDRRRTSPATIIVLALLGLALVGGSLYLALTAGDESAFDDAPQVVEGWCADVSIGFEPPAPIQSFAELAAAILDGELERPADDPPFADPEGTDRWQRANAAYLTSSYVRLISEYPRELTWDLEILNLSLDEAHAADPISYPDDLERAAATLDRYVKHRC